MRYCVYKENTVTHGGPYITEVLIFMKDIYMRKNENRLQEIEHGAADRHILFVYGSLMKGRYNHDAYMGRAVYLGRASIRGFALYDLGYFPGILHDSRDSRVYGELYEVSGEDFERICQLEGNGFLYQCESVPAGTEDSFDEVMAETFVYLGKAEEDKRIQENDHPWGCSRMFRS